MDFRCPSRLWLKGVTAVQNAIGSALSNPVLETVLVSCSGQRVCFRATNLSLTVQCCCNAVVEEAGDVALPGKIIIGLVRDLPLGEVYFRCRETDVEMSCGGFHGTMKGLLGEEFPALQSLAGGLEWTVPVGVLRSAIRRTIFATSVEKSRFELDGIKVDLRDGTLFFVATDGRRLSQVTYRSDELPSEPISLLVPTRAMSELLRSLPSSGDVRVAADERRVRFSFHDVVPRAGIPEPGSGEADSAEASSGEGEEGRQASLVGGSQAQKQKEQLHEVELTIISNLLPDKFPPYEKIIPRDGPFNLEVDRVPFLEAIRRVSDLTSEDTLMVILNLEQDCMTILGERPEVGSRGKEQLPISYNGDPMDIRYNYRFLMDVLTRAMDKEKVRIELWSETHPSVLTEVGAEDFVYVLMPMKPPEESSAQEGV